MASRFVSPGATPAQISAVAIFRDEALVIAILLGLERRTREVRVQIHVVNAQAQRRAQDDFVEYGRGGVDDQVCAASRAHDGPQVPRVRLDHFDRALFAEKPLRAGDVAIAAPDRVPLARQQMGQQRAGAARPQNEDAHRRATLSQSMQCGVTRLAVSIV